MSFLPTCFRTTFTPTQSFRFVDEVRSIPLDGYLGLAPGEGNLIVQLFAQRSIPAPIAALTAAGESFLKVGSLPSECDQWAFHATLRNSWIFLAKRVDIFGFEFRDQAVSSGFFARTAESLRCLTRFYPIF